MLVMFALGMGSIGWMLAIAAVMAIEKNVAKATFLGPLIGVVLLGSAVWVAVR
jgi:predicted metal-binding membrane protein